MLEPKEADRIERCGHHRRANMRSSALTRLETALFITSALLMACGLIAAGIG
jgi:hypothetical protein